MIFPLRRIAACLPWLAAGLLFVVAAGVAPPAEAQSSATKRAAPPAKTKSKAVARPPSTWVANPAVAGRDAYLILDATSGRELSAENPDELRHPASLTKLMTIYLCRSTR